MPTKLFLLLLITINYLFAQDIIKNKIDINLGLVVNALGELQNNVGIFFVDKKSNLIIIGINF